MGLIHASRSTAVAIALLCAMATVCSLTAQASGDSPGGMPSAAAPAPATVESGSQAAGVLLSRQLMEAYRLAPGDLITLSADPAGGNARQFRIVAQYEPTPDPLRLGAARHEVHLHLPDLLDMVADPSNPLDAESVDTINLIVDAPDQTAASQRLAGMFPGLVARPSEGLGRRAAPFVVLERFHLAIAVVTVVASSIFLLALMLMVVDERRSTVGILRLIGLRRRRILLHVLAEGIVIAVVGALFGIVLSVAMQGGINAFFQWRYDTALVFVRITPGVVLRSIAVAIPLGVAAIVASSWSLLAAQVFSLTRR